MEYLKGEEVSDHPLASREAPKAAPSRASESKAKLFEDPLADPLSGGFDDPLSDPLSVSTPKEPTKTPGNLQSTPTPQAAVYVADNNFTPWSAMKPDILSKFTTNDKIAIEVNFMDQKEVGKANMPVDKTKERLEQLEESEEAAALKEQVQVSQTDYLSHIEALHSELIRAWDAEERVKSLKIVIQVAKLLADTNPAQFYPSKFVIATEILDTFGRLIYDRIRNRAPILDASGKPKPITDSDSSDISETARETCRNWFYKIASIRELMPRFYVETAILVPFFLLISEMLSLPQDAVRARNQPPQWNVSRYWKSFGCNLCPLLPLASSS